MFFVRGLSTNGKPVFVNPDQVLYVHPVGVRRTKTALVMTHRERLVVDQDAETVRLRFEDYLRDIARHQGLEELNGDDDSSPREVS